MAIAKAQHEQVETIGLQQETSKRKKREQSNNSYLRFLRKSTGLTLESLAEITGISISYLSRLESGSRRLNTDLISRLSKAFGCDPAELLHDFSGNELGKVLEKPRGLVQGYVPGGTRYMKHIFSPFQRKVFESRVDIPIYELCHSTDEHLIMRVITGENQYRPAELANRSNAVAIKTHGYFEPYFCKGAILYAVPGLNISPEATVVVSLKNDAVILRKIWSITPNSAHLCTIDKIEEFKRDGLGKSLITSYANIGDSLENINNEPIVEIKRDLIKDIYSVVGYFDTSLL
jgi:transcriptional regulator with XRE-family HTH domain